MSIIQERFKKAREFLGLSKNAAAKNFDYAIYLIENGINPYFLIGKSEEIAGQKIAGFVSEEEYEKLKKEFETLQNKYETLREILQIEVDEEGNVKKQK